MGKSAPVLWSPAACLSGTGDVVWVLKSDEKTGGGGEEEAEETEEAIEEEEEGDGDEDEDNKTI